MGAGFSITIGAVDTTAGIFAKVNKHLADLQAPAKRLGQQVSKFTELTGLKKVSAGFDGIVRSSLGAARSVARVSEPLAAITGVASIGGFTMLIEKWATLNTTLGFAAQAMGVLPQQLGQLRASGALAGGSADAMQSGFQALGQTLYDVANGQAPQAAYILSRLGIGLTDATGRARKAQDVMPQLADAIARIKNPLAQARLATMLFGGAGMDMLPVLRGGAAGMAELDRQAARYGGTTQAGVAAALQFTRAQGAVSQAVVGLTDAVATQLAPVISPLLLQLANWIARGRTSRFVMHDLAEDVKGVATWLQNINFSNVIADVEAFGDKVLATLHGLDGWRITLDKLLGIDPGGPTPASTAAALTPDQRVRFARLGPIGQLPPDEQRQYYLANEAAAGDPANADQKARAAYLMAYFQKNGGYTRAQAAGIAGNAMRESGFNPQASNQSGAQGVFQWRGSRIADFEKWAGFGLMDPRATLDKQYDFALFEMSKGKEQEAGRDIRLTRTPTEAGMFAGLSYERPGGGNPEIMRRAALAKQLYDTVPTGMDVPLGTSNWHITPVREQPPDFDSKPAGQVAITITHDGVGKVTARAKGNVSTPRIATAMTADSAVSAGIAY